MSDLTGLGEVAKQATALLKAKPIYEDVAQPAAQEVGKALGTVGKTINAALAPLRFMVWGMDRIESYLKDALEERLKDTPPEYVITPSPQVAGPAVQALQFVAENEVLRRMYANLIATAMDSRVAMNAHPAFVETLKQLTVYEANILKLIAGRQANCVISVHSKEYSNDPFTAAVFELVHCWMDCASGCGYEDHGMTQAFLGNLERLGLVHINMTGSLAESASIYNKMQNHPYVMDIRHRRISLIAKHGGKADFEFVDGVVRVSALGKQFAISCGMIAD